MTIPEPRPGDQPTYIDPVTGAPLYIDPATGSLSYTDPAAPSSTVPYPAAGYAPPGYPSGAAPRVDYPAPDQGGPQPGFTAPQYAAPYAQPAYGYPGYSGYPMGGPAVAPRTNPLAITSMVLSICGLVFLACYGGGLLLGLVGAILGHVGRKQARLRSEGGGGMALAGIIMGWIAVGLGIVIVGLVIWLFSALVHDSDNVPTPFPS